jgi:hypothetical protein
LIKITISLGLKSDPGIEIRGRKRCYRNMKKDT